MNCKFVALKCIIRLTMFSCVWCFVGLGSIFLSTEEVHCKLMPNFTGNKMPCSQISVGYICTISYFKILRFHVVGPKTRETWFPHYAVPIPFILVSAELTSEWCATSIIVSLMKYFTGEPWLSNSWKLSNNEMLSVYFLEAAAVSRWDDVTLLDVTQRNMLVINYC